MEFAGFPAEGLRFLSDLESNNSKEWFEANRDRYERYILRPSKAFVTEMGEHLRLLVPSINAIPKVNHSLFRIYRDSRLRPAEPIKTRIGIIFWQGSGHRMQSSSFYMHFDKSEVFIAAGIRNFKPQLLKKYRQYIQNEEKRTQLHDILQTLRDKGYNIPTPHYKRYPADFNADDKHAYLSLYRSAYAYAVFKTDETFSSEELVYRNFKIYEDMLDLQQWVYEMTV